MVANAIGRSSVPRPYADDEALEFGLREKINRQLGPVLSRLKNRWVLLGLFLAAYVPFGLMFMNAYQDHNVLKAGISAQQAVLALPEPRTDDIETGFRSWTAALQAANDAQVLELPDSGMVEKLLDVASSAGVRIASLSTSPNNIVPVGTEAYDVTPILMRVDGGLPQLEVFIGLLEGDAVGAVEIQSSLLTPGENGFLAAIRVLVFNKPVSADNLTSEQLEGLSRRVTDAELDAAAQGGR